MSETVLIKGLTRKEYQSAWQKEWRKRNPQKYRKIHDAAYEKRKTKEHEQLGVCTPDQCKCVECKCVFDRSIAHLRGFKFFGRFNCICDHCSPDQYATR